MKSPIGTHESGGDANHEGMEGVETTPEDDGRNRVFSYVLVRNLNQSEHYRQAKADDDLEHSDAGDFA